ncbi:hypothetical protein CYMTET_30998 [Cymbomonas tetramitiformis]|uniref:Glycoside hydrolase 123 catalytic domain-containing protein n=1 Tax=Cymbomonas tetramitiformis TaxID=36881 RepID=A0AAE0FI01_9CHLO|nr:hypothetical protein CYMTET_30998 [Cymbomonas tetramitiformis]
MTTCGWGRPQGYLYWGANCYDTGASEPAAPVGFREGLPAGDGVLFYPGEAFGLPQAVPGAPAQPVASVRLERLLAGLQDFEYLEAYSDRFGRGAAERLLSQGAAVYARPSQFTTTFANIATMRAIIARDLSA